MMRLGWLVLVLTGLNVVGVQAQGSSTSVKPISSTTIMDLAPVHQIDFAGLADLQGHSLDVVNGWFALSPDGSLIALKSDDNQVVVVDAEGNVQQVYAAPLDRAQDDLPATFIDAAFSPDGRWLASAHTLGSDLYVVVLSLDGAFEPVEQVFPQAGYPTRVWISTSNEIWLEMVPDMSRDDPRPYLLAAWALEPCDSAPCSDLPMEYPSGPDQDADSFVRVGRIRQDAAITVTQDFVAKRWDLVAGEVVATGQLNALPGMGALTPNLRFFAWRDNESMELRLLDFDIGMDRLITPLNGAYIPFLLLDPAADVIIGVHVAGDDRVTAWLVQDGERLDLGMYRACNRPPDLAALNLQGTQLVIGCDLGLEIWRAE
ncbi:MAG TPA: hypothetical protein PLQ56_26530 [Aggregatilineales bacterium]|nr:hypothetical protein [Aggregatilineales bacterium]